MGDARQKSVWLNVWHGSILLPRSTGCFWPPSVCRHSRHTGPVDSRSSCIEVRLCSPRRLVKSSGSGCLRRSSPRAFRCYRGRSRRASRAGPPRPDRRSNTHFDFNCVLAPGRYASCAFSVFDGSQSSTLRSFRRPFSSSELSATTSAALPWKILVRRKWKATREGTRADAAQKGHCTLCSGCPLHPNPKWR